MTKHKEKEEDIIERKDIKKEAVKEASEIEHSQDDLDLREKINLAEKQAAEYLDGWKRCKADFENYKKRQAEALKDLALYSNENMILQILPILDNFHASTEHVPEDQKNNPWVVGIMHIQKQLEKVLEDNGVSEIKVKEGDKFDPALHEAIKSDANDTSKHSNDTNKIMKVILKGYKIGEKVIRPARVVVE